MMYNGLPNILEKKEELKSKKKEISGKLTELVEYAAEKDLTVSPEMVEEGDYIECKDGSWVRSSYIISIVNTLSKVCKNEDELLEGGKQLIDLTFEIYNANDGSAEYITEAVPNLVKSGLVKTKDELIRGAEIIADLPMRVRGADGSSIFSKTARDIAKRKFNSIDELTYHRN